MTTRTIKPAPGDLKAGMYSPIPFRGLLIHMVVELGRSGSRRQLYNKGLSCLTQKRGVS
ncbi:hypothetical protein DPMN_014345 [Dreissena polymorpha]|uniref:Uncharacterized protein n=1 Tax=Dreissena polymorpha TaxID=45954 RepID=A0A9D4N744_DREPO|nr:hypothetical protein DPMN_014345 [Dreissena polymorpha]